MKHLFLLPVFIGIFTLITSAQIKKGSILLGGQIFYGDSRTDYKAPLLDQKSKSAHFNISAGSALKENSVLGLLVAYSHTDFDHNYNGNSYTNIKSDRYGFDVFYRRYKKLVKDFYFFGELGAGYFGFNETDTETPTNNKTKYSQSGAELYLTPGISYRIYKKLQVELLVPQIAGMNYSVLKRTSPSNSSNDSKEKQFGVTTNLNASPLSNLGLGFRFVL